MAKTQQDALDWINNMEGKVPSADGSSGCVALIRNYYTFFGAAVVSGNGKDYATNPINTAIFTRVTYKSGMIPRPGDIIVWSYIPNDHGLGHVAIVVSADSSKITVLESISEQTGPDQYWGTSKARKNNYSYSSGTIACFIQPKFDSTPPPPAMPTTSVSIANGVYAIQHKGSGKYITSYQNGNSGDQLYIYSDAGSPYADQRYNFERLSDNTYKITCVFNSRAIDVKGIAADNRTPVIQAPYNGGDNQRWYIVDAGGGYYEFVPKYVNKAMEIDGNMTADGAKVQINERNGTDAQKFKLIIPPAVALSSIRIETNPAKMTYYTNETLDTTGLSLAAIYNDGTKKIVTDGYACSPTTFTTVGSQQITVTYSNKTTTFTVEVKESPKGLTPIGQFVTRLYQNVLGRAPDAAGLNYWYDNLASHALTGAQATANFFLCSEFINKNVDDTTLLTILYKTCMNRNPDDAGLAYWKGIMAKGWSRKYILNQFMISNEFKSICASYGIIPGSITLRNSELKPGVTAFVSRLFTTFMNRTADSAGLDYWTGQIILKGLSPKTIATSFVNSAEFQSKNLGNVQYVTSLYNGLLGRAPDTAGLNYWVGQINANPAARKTLLNQFLASSEFAGICAGFGL